MGRSPQKTGMGKTPDSASNPPQLMVQVMIDNSVSPVAKPAGTLVQCPSSPRRRILVVEDDRDLRRINAMVLHHAGYHVDTAEDGASGWKALQANHYDVLITDNNMPVVTGLELIMKVRSEEMPLSVILASGTAPTEELNRHPWLQLDAVLLKPYSTEAILVAVKKVLHEADGQQVFGSFDSKKSETTPDGKAASAPIKPPTSPLRRILVVEDEPDIRRLNAEVLMNSGYHVDTAEDGKAGWEVLHAARHAPTSYDLLITDHDMPGLTGLALIKKVRAARMVLPVIVATGTLPTEDLMNRYPWLQPVATLVKPYSIEQLLGTVEAVLHTADGIREQIALPLDRPSARGLQL
jgi:two-component system sensor histidine kinase/response regulator